jgi:hypothetical protein
MVPRTRRFFSLSLATASSASALAGNLHKQRLDWKKAGLHWNRAEWIETRRIGLKQDGLGRIFSQRERQDATQRVRRTDRP